MRAFFLLAAFAAFMAAGPAAHALGQKEDPIKQADALLAAKKYNEAILFLTDFINRNPDRFDEAQSRLKQAIAARDTYNRLGEELLSLYEKDREAKDPAINERKLAIIQQMGDILPNDPRTKEFVDKVRLLAEFYYNKAQYEKIFAQGRTLIDQGKYTEAAQLYQGGFVYYRKNFDEQPKIDDLTKRSVAGIVDGIKNEVDAFGQAQQELVRATAIFRAALAQGDPEAAANAWPAAKAVLVERARRRDLVVNAGHALERMDGPIRKAEGRTTDDAFLPFAFRFTLGQASAEKPEGITGAMDSQWTGLVGGLEEAFLQSLDSRFKAAEASWEAGFFDAAAADFESAVALSVPGLEALGLWSLLAPTEVLPVPTRYGRTVIQAKAMLYEAAKHQVAIADSMARLAHDRATTASDLKTALAFGAGLKAEAAAAEAQAAMATLAEARKAIAALEARMDAERSLAAKAAQELARWKAQDLAAPASEALQAGYEGRIAAALDSALQAQVAITSASLGFEYQRFALEFATREAGVAAGEGLLEPASGAAAAASGTEAPAGAPRYPTRSIARLASEGTALADLMGRLSAYLKRIAVEPARISSAPLVQQWTDSGKELEAKAADLERRRAADLAKAQDRKRQADAKKGEGDKLLSDTRRLLAANDFENAIARLKSANDSYNLALALDADAAVPAERLSLETAIKDAAQNFADQLKPKGTASYYQGNFATAKDIFTTAQSLVKLATDGGTDVYIEIWLANTNRALSATSGIHVLPTDGNYAMVSQNLSLAYLYLEQGKALSTPKRTPEGDSLLDKATKQVDLILQAYPLNQEATILRLRITQVRDPEEYRKTFAGKVQAARAKLDSPTVETIADLTNLLALDPNYPGLKALLERAKAIFNRTAPPDPKAQQAANDYLDRALGIITKRTYAQLKTAEGLVRQALDLDPNNKRASAVSRQLTQLYSDMKTIALDPADEARYREATQEFQGGNFVQAKAIVDALLAQPRYSRSDKLLTLLKKIEANL
jgi:hypothetical protein